MPIPHILVFFDDVHWIINVQKLDLNNALYTYYTIIFENSRIM